MRRNRDLTWLVGIVLVLALAAAWAVQGEAEDELVPARPTILAPAAPRVTATVVTYTRIRVETGQDNPTPRCERFVNYKWSLSSFQLEHGFLNYNGAEEIRLRLERAEFQNLPDTTWVEGETRHTITVECAGKTDRLTFYGIPDKRYARVLGAIENSAAHQDMLTAYILRLPWRHCGGSFETSSNGRRKRL